MRSAEALFCGTIRPRYHYVTVSAMPKPQKVRRKLLLAAPVSLRWPTVDDDCRSQLLERFRNVIAACESKTTPYLAVGINAATRALEKGQLSALILNSSADPPRLLHGIIRLARGKSTPVLCVSQLHEWMPSLGSLLALGLRRSAPFSKPVDAFLNAVRQNVPSDSAKGPEDECLVDSDKCVKNSGLTVGSTETAEAQQNTEGKPNKAGLPSVCAEESSDVIIQNSSVVQKPVPIGVSEMPAAVPLDIELRESGVLGFPSYGWPCESFPVVEEPTSRPSQKVKTGGGRQRSSGFVKANIKQVCSKGKIKIKKKRGMLKKQKQ